LASRSGGEVLPGTADVRVSAGQSTLWAGNVGKNLLRRACGGGSPRSAGPARPARPVAHPPSSPAFWGSRPWTTDPNFSRHDWSGETFAGEEFVVSYRTPYMMLITECLAGRASGGVFWICEQAARTCSAVATDVSGLKATTIHCLP